ncbi:cupin domain-containing protein (plasmid) [Nocardioides sp. R1-1]|uniref:cupin domain-containing protein n=1 Tax=Nocardioides sp. R1-1 TaxID=3383502 RepID=UPI0038D072D5
MEIYPNSPMTAYPPSGNCRTIYGDPSGARTTPVIMEWELVQGEFSDEHPYDEINFVLDGELHVESEGECVVAQQGDTVRVLAGSIGVYRAPRYARMLLVYDHNPFGVETAVHFNRSLRSTSENESSTVSA